MADLAVGRSATICDLKGSPELNGQSGLLLMFDESKKRWLIQLDDGSKKMLRGANLQAASTMNMAEAMREAPVPSFQEGSGLSPGLDQFQWFEVIKNMVFVKQDPFKDAYTVAIARMGQKIEVYSRRVFDTEGHWWAELTIGQMRRSDCKDAEGDPARHGYTLIDATHLGLGQLMRGPLPQSEWPAIEELPPPPKPEPPPPPPAPVKPVVQPAPPPPAAAEEEDTGDEFHWFEVATSMIFVKCAPHKDSKTVAIAQQGDLVQVLPEIVPDEEGNPWVELTGPQIQHMSCDFEEGLDKVAYLLLDGSHLGLGRMLNGPLPRSRWPSQPFGQAEAEEPQAGEAEPAAAPPEEDPAAGVPMSVEVQTLEVVCKEGVVVRYEATDDSEDLARIEFGERIDVEEETFDGWARIVCDAGWIRRCARTKKDGLVQHLRPVGTLPHLALMEVQERPGRRPFEVVHQPYVYVRSEPSSAGQVKGSMSFRKIFWAVSQRYDGWLRLQDNAGWAPSVSRSGDKLVHAPLFLELVEWCDRTRSAGSHWAHGNPVSFGEDMAPRIREKLQQARAGDDPEELLDAIKRARALNLPAEDIKSAEYQLEELRRLWRDPAAKRPVAPPPAAKAPAPRKRTEAAEPTGPAAAALADLASAAASGDAASIRSATAAAKAAGASKKDIARVFALHSGGG
uniref:Uncharacterized protein n=1 Tax=Alexandrium catenella TaxID=2925 RepID=A0A7S1WVH8_ALECA